MELSPNFNIFFWCSEEHFLFYLRPYLSMKVGMEPLGVTARIEPAWRRELIPNFNSLSPHKKYSISVAGPCLDHLLVKEFYSWSFLYFIFSRTRSRGLNRIFVPAHRRCFWNQMCIGVVLELGKGTIANPMWALPCYPPNQTGWKHVHIDQ